MKNEMHRLLILDGKAFKGNTMDIKTGGVLNFKVAKLGVGCLLSTAMACLPWGSANAQAMREVIELPRDCAQFIPPQARGTLQPWQVFVRLEHCDRMKRLRRLSEVLPADQRPRFYEGVIPASRLPREFGTDMPVLRVVFPDRTFFDTGRANLRPEARHVASIVAESLRREPPDVAMFVAGHADSRGSDEANEALSQNRADAVARTIYRLGVNFTSIWRIGFGEDMPLHNGESDPDHARNRRVEFLFSAKPEAVGIWLADQQFDELCQSSSMADSASCSDKLAFRAGYDAEVVNPRGTPLVLPPAPKVPPVKVQPVGRGRTVVGPQGPIRRPVTPLTPQVRAQLIPANVRKIRIDPVNPDSKPVTVIL